MNAKDIAMVGVFTAILVVCSKLTIPTPLVPFTLQTLAVLMIGSTLKPKLALSAILLYLLIGLFGIPVFAGSSAGPAIFVSPNGGYLFAWIFSTAFLSYSTFYIMHGNHYDFISPLIASLITLILGTIWLKFDTGITWKVSFLSAFMPFIIPEILKSIVSTLVSKKLRKIIYQN